jgi:hypothetical protein
MGDSRGIVLKVVQYREEPLADPSVDTLLDSRRPSRLAGIWKSDPEIHCVDSDHKFCLSGRVGYFLRKKRDLWSRIPRPKSIWSRFALDILGIR